MYRKYYYIIKVQLEINDRVAFLESMTELGRRKQYEAIIKTEISQVKLEFSENK